MTLELARGFSLPIDAVTETFAILAKRGAGKTYAASVLAEEMLKAKLQTVVLDPMGAWWGLRSSADGKGPGFPLAVLGGPHGDVPLEATGGVIVADLVVDESLSAIVDVSDFSKTERRRFVTDFVERLYQRNRDPMHVFIEEADLFAPQGRGGGDRENARMLGAMYDLVRRGRGRGIGSTLITQRSASISKEVLEQAEILIALRTTGPRDRAAIEGWISVHGEKEQEDAVMGSLPSLQTGTAWMWWPVEGILKKVNVRERETFDSSATPKVGEKRREPKTVADVDLGALQERMAATIEKAKATDPKELTRRIRELEQELRSKPIEPKVETKTVEVAVLSPEVEKMLRVLSNGAVERIESIGVELRHQGDSLAEAARDIRDKAGAVLKLNLPVRPLTTERPAPLPPRRAVATVERPRVAAVATGELSGYAEDLLGTLVERHPMRLSRTQLSTLSGRSKKSSMFAPAVRELVGAGLVTEQGGKLELTDQGVAQGGADHGTPMSSAEVQEMWLRKLPAYEASLLRVLIEAGGQSISREELSERSGRSTTSSMFAPSIKVLVDAGLAELDGADVRAGEALYL